MDIGSLYAGLENVGWAIMLPVKISQFAVSILWDSHNYMLFCIGVMVAYILGESIGELMHGAVTVMASAFVIVQGYLTLTISVIAYVVGGIFSWTGVGPVIIKGIEMMASFMTEWVLDILCTILILLIYLPIIIFSSLLVSNATWCGTLSVGTAASWLDNILTLIPILGDVLRPILKFVPIYTVTWLFSYLTGGGCLYPRTNYLCNFARARNFMLLERFSLRCQEVFSWHPVWLFRFSWRIERRKRQVYFRLKELLG